MSIKQNKFKNKKPSLYVLSLSGGKDSTALLLRLLEENRPLDLVLFCDTGLEFPAMYAHIAKLERNVSIPIKHLQSDYPFLYWFRDYMPKRKNPDLEKYRGLSWAGPRNRWCTAVMKIRVVERYLRNLRKDYNIIQYIGIAADEPKRIRKEVGIIYPLVEWGMTEADCLQYCYERGYDWDGLYNLFKRVSCWCCPLQSLSELRKLHKHFPELWVQLREMDDSTWRTFKPGYSVHDLELRFGLEKEYSDERKAINTKAFFSELKQRIAESKASWP